MIPPDYKCHECGLTGVKLWRDCNESRIELKCWKCAEESQGHKIDLVETDSCAWLVPAIPDLQGSYWGYTSVPYEGCQWWKALPLKLEGEWRDKDGVYRWCSYQEGMKELAQSNWAIDLIRVDYHENKTLLRFKR